MSTTELNIFWKIEIGLIKSQSAEYLRLPDGLGKHYSCITKMSILVAQDVAQHLVPGDQIDLSKDFVSQSGEVVLPFWLKVGTEKPEKEITRLLGHKLTVQKRILRGNQFFLICEID